MRDRLIALLDGHGDDLSFCDICDRPTADCEGCKNEQLADYLLANDVVEVVRCKDCVHKVELHGRVMCGRTARGDGNVIMGLVATDDDGFCSHGGRR